MKEKDMVSTLPHRNALRTTLRVATLLFFPLLGYIGANILSHAYSEGIFVKWHSLGNPSTGVVNIVGGDPWTVWWEAKDGQIYEADIENCRNLEESCWRKAGAIDTYYYSEQGAVCDSGFSHLKSPPGGLLKCFTVQDLGAEWYGETHYALLQDGSIWYWKHSISGLGPSGLIGVHGLLLCGGIFTGLFVGLVVFFIRKRPKEVLTSQG